MVNGNGNDNGNGNGNYNEDGFDNTNDHDNANDNSVIVIMNIGSRPAAAGGAPGGPFAFTGPNTTGRQGRPKANPWLWGHCLAGPRA